jgi:hypothetical protein
LGQGQLTQGEEKEEMHKQEMVDTNVLVRTRVVGVLEFLYYPRIIEKTGRRAGGFRPGHVEHLGAFSRRHQDINRQKLDLLYAQKSGLVPFL